MGMVQVKGGHKKHAVMIYSISTCVPCSKTKAFLDDQSVGYDYLDLDTAEPWERSEAMIEIGEHLPIRGVNLALPIIIIDGYVVILGFDKRNLSEQLDM